MLAKFIQKTINKLGYVETARIMGLNPSTLKSFLNGSKPRSDTLKKMMSNFDVWMQDMNDDWIDFCNEIKKV